MISVEDFFFLKASEYVVSLVLLFLQIIETILFSCFMNLVRGKRRTFKMCYVLSMSGNINVYCSPAIQLYLIIFKQSKIWYTLIKMKIPFFTILRLTNCYPFCNVKERFDLILMCSKLSFLGYKFPTFTFTFPL